MENGKDTDELRTGGNGRDVGWSEACPGVDGAI
jgi:hypothetical protein